MPHTLYYTAGSGNGLKPALRAWLARVAQALSIPSLDALLPR